jgi:hypothetical protein
MTFYADMSSLRQDNADNLTVFLLNAAHMLRCREHGKSWQKLAENAAKYLVSVENEAVARFTFSGCYEFDPLMLKAGLSWLIYWCIA